MKHLTLQNPSFEYLEQGFKEWLDILGYCNMGIYNMPNNLREFLYYLEQQAVKSINQLTQKHIKSYHQYINSRPNQRRSGGLSDKYILMHMQAIEKFLAYLNHKGIQNLPSLGIRLTTPQRKEPTVLSQTEVKLLFEATQRETNRAKQEAVNARDKALLVVYYSCGLRRNEGVHLQIDDINFDTRILHVKKGKNYKERFVPLNKTNAKYLEEYIYDYRPQLIQDKKEGRLFVSIVGKPMGGGRLYSRLKLLQLQCDDVDLQQKNIGLHTLRHSIATHLLQAGMSLEKIAQFLGHSTMDSTQIYTHLISKEHAHI
jgi:integrase/recombinase XerD